MKKLILALTLVTVAVVTADLSARMGGCCKREKVVKKCGQPKVCETEYINHPMPNLNCVKEVEVAAPCSLKRIIETSYVADCPAGYHEA